MPVTTTINNSPSCKFKLCFCSKCNDEIQQDLELKCDYCAKYFHNHCMTDSTDKELDDLILLCDECAKNGSICSKKDQLDIKSSKKTSPEPLYQPEPRKLRQRAISVDYFGINKRKGANSKATTTNIQYEDLLQKINTMQNQINRLENRKCNCFVSFQNKQTNPIRESIDTASTKTPTPSDLIDDLTDAIDSTCVITNLIEENKKFDIRLNKIDRALMDLAVFEKSNHDGLMSTISSNKNDAQKLLKLSESVDTCSALHETNLSALIETQKIISEHSDRIEKCEAKSFMNGEHFVSSFNTDYAIEKQNLDDKLKEVKEDFDKLFNIMTDFAIALKRHNNTIKTHFVLNDAYNEDITMKFESKLKDIAIINKNHTQKNLNTNNNNNSNRFKINNHSDHSSRGTLMLKSMQHNKQQSDKIKVSLRNINTHKTIGEIQTELGTTFEQCSEKIKNIKWFTNKINYDPENHHITAAIMIAILPENINITELTKHVGNFFGKAAG